MYKISRISKKVFSGIALAGLVFVQANPLVAFAVQPPVDPDLYTGYYPVAKDSYVDQDSHGNKNTTNYGSSTGIDVKSENGNENRRTFIAVNNLALSPSTVVESAELYVYMYNEASNNSNRTYGIYQVLGSWAENTITWNNKPNASTSPISTTVITPGPGKWVSFNVTSDIKQIVAGQSTNNGWMIRDMSEDASQSNGYLGQFRSKEYSVNNACPNSPSVLCRPYLKITYHQYNGGIFGNVWNDANTDGIKDESELPQAGEVISLVGPISTTTVTNENGIYFAQNLPSGAYTVCRSALNTTAQSFPLSGATCPNNTSGTQVQVVGSVTAGPDFGVYQAGSIKVVLQLNPALTGDSFQVALLKDNATTSTHTLYGAGEYTFGGLVPGQYSLNNMFPSWWLGQNTSCVQGETSVSPSALLVTAGSQTVCTINLVKSASLTVTNYVNPVQGTYSYALTKPTELGDQIIFAPVELENTESHTFMPIVPGMYNLMEIIDGAPVGETAICFIGNTTVDPRVGPFEILPGANIQCTYNHGEVSVIQGAVFEDKNADAVRDDIDVSLSGWVVKLYKITEELVVPTDGADPVPTTVKTEVSSKVSNQTGYVFGYLNPGTYTVCEELQSGFTQTLPLTDEGCGSTRGYTVTLNFGDVVNKHFGNFQKASVAGLVFNDVNNNGVKDSGETGLSGITVSNGVTTTSTDGSGNYSFGELNPGSYTISIVVPSGSAYSVPVSGTYSIQALSGESYTDKDFGIFTDTDTPSLPVHLSPADGAVVKPAGLVLDWTDVVDPSGSAVSYKYQSALSNATTTGNALSTPIYNATLSSSQIDASGTSDGTYFWQVKACDTANNCTDWTNPWSLTVDSVLPTSIFTAPASSTSITGDFITITGSTTDTHGVASTSLLFAPWTPGEGENPGSCGAYSHIVSLVNTSSTNPFDWTFNWTPTENGVYCITAQGQDSAGNVETSTVITNISFTKATTTDGGNGGGSNGGGGSGGSGGSSGGSSGSNGGGGGSNGGGAGGNGPIVGSFGGGFGVGGDAGGNTGSTGTNTGNTGNAGNTGAAGGTVLTGTEGGFGGGDLASSAGMTDLDTYYGNTTSTPTTTISDADDNTDQVAAVGFLGGWSNWYWLWILLLIIIILGVYYSTRRRENK